MKKLFIYTLSDPTTNEIRYIGKTSNIKDRLNAHINEALHMRRNKHKCRWLLSILKKGKKPIIEVLEEVSVDTWKSSEIYWINQFKTWGFRLVNMSEGGDGGDRYGVGNPKAKGQRKGFKHSEETKLIIKEKRSLQVITEEHKKNISKGTKGKILSEETKLKISLSNKGKSKSEEHVKKSALSRTKKIKETDEKGNIKIWDSAQEIADHYGISISSVKRAAFNKNFKSKVLKNIYEYFKI